MRVFLVNNDGGGFSDYVEVADKTAYQTFFTDKVGGDPKSYKIRVNRNGERFTPAGGDLVQDGDKVSITPAKIVGNA